MWLQFFLENIHFAINLFAALVFLAVSYLYFDAWLGRKSIHELLRSLGFFLLSGSFAIASSTLETELLSQSLIEGNLFNLAYVLSHLAGFILIIASLFHDHLQANPKTVGLTKETYALSLSSWPGSAVIMLSPFLALIVGGLYIRRAVWGLENHLKLIGFSFFVLSISEGLSLVTFLRSTENVNIYNLVAPFGIIWIIQHIILLLAVLLLGRWIFAYLLKQLQTQLMMLFAIGILLIFLITTVTFTTLLIRNLQQETLSQLETNVKILNLTLESQKQQNLSDAQALAQNPTLQKAIIGLDNKVATDSAQAYLTAKKLSSVIIVDRDSQVLARGEDVERVGDSLSGNSMVKKALLGQPSSSIVVHQGVVAPLIEIVSAVPISSDPQTTIGAVLVGTLIENGFIDNIKKVSSLEASVYGNDILSATTLTLADNRSRAVGTSLSDRKIVTQVLKAGRPYTGEANILNKSYFVSILPLKDADNIPVGMLVVADLQTGTLIAAGKSLELTFIVAAVMLMVSILPALVISRKIAGQLH